MSQTPPPAKGFVFSDDDDDEHIEGGGIPDFDGWIYLKEKQDGAKLSEGDSGKRKAVSGKPKLVQRAVKRAPKRNS